MISIRTSSGSLDERDSRAVRHVDRPLHQLGAQAREPLDLGVEVLHVDAEVLDAPVDGRIAAAHLLPRPFARDVDRHAVRRLAPDEPVAVHPSRIAQDLESEGLHVPVGRLLRVRRFDVNVVELVCHAPPLASLVYVVTGSKAMPCPAGCQETG